METQNRGTLVSDNQWDYKTVDHMTAKRELDRLKADGWELDHTEETTLGSRATNFIFRRSKEPTAQA